MENRIVEIISKYLHRTITAQEFEELKQWISFSENNRTEFESVVSAYKHQMALDFILENRTIHSKKRSKHRFLLIRSIAAVLVVGLVASSVLFMRANRSNEDLAQHDSPERNKRSLLLEASNNHLIVMESGNRVDVDKITHNGIQLTENSLDYSKMMLNDTTEAIESIPTSIKIPKGKRFQVILSDGTKLWINSDSYVEYESIFQGSERRIKVIGEVYLEVAHDATKPFIVETRNTEIKVLGTKFNLSAYPDDAIISTTLLEGSVLFNHETILSPNEQLRFDKFTSKSELKQVDVSQFTSWIDGVYRFDNITLLRLTELFNRVYGVNIEIMSEKSIKKTFTGAIHSKLPLDEMFNAIMKTTKIEYVIEKEKIVIW